jgi:hypothetical protein
LTPVIVDGERRRRRKRFARGRGLSVAGNEFDRSGLQRSGGVAASGDKSEHEYSEQCTTRLHENPREGKKRLAENMRGTERR